MSSKEWCERRYLEEWKPAYDLFIKLYPFDLADLPGEVWLPIPDFETIYHESNYGRTKSFQRGREKILTPVLHKGGYLRVGLWKDGKNKLFNVARLVATLFIPNPEGKPEVNHLAGRFNSYFKCLEWATGKENMEHAVSTGLAKSGTDSVHAAIKNEADILYIRDNPDNLTGEQLAEIFNCKQNTISYIQLGKKYANCGGTIRKARKQKPHRHLTPEEKAEIRRLYVKGSKEFGTRAFARKYGCTPPTILNIVNAKA